LRRALLALVTSTSVALATPSSDLETGRRSFRARDYQSAIPVLNALLYPRPQLSLTADLVEAHLLLAGSLFEYGNRDRAREEFERALQLEPDRTISTLQFSEGAVKMFEDAKADIASKLRRDEELRRIADAKAQLEAYKKSLVVYEARPYYTNFLPFGLPQVGQKRYLAGALLGVGQGAALGTNLGIYLYLLGTYGFTNDSVPLVDGPSVRRLQQIQIGTGVAFLALYAYSVFDAIKHYKPRLRVEGDDSLVPHELLDNNAPRPPRRMKTSKPVSLRDRVQLSPMVSESPDGLGWGIGLGWEND